MSDVVSHEAVIDHPHEGHWPLVAMLVLTQASVGMWCVVSGLLLVSGRPASDFAWTAIIASSLGVVGVHLALLHLGRPWLAFRAFLGWRTSWLSREAIAFGIYMGAASAAAFAFLVPSLIVLTSLLAFSTALIGIVAVACSAMIYIATQRALWDFPRTTIEFAACTLGLGLASVAAIDGTASSSSLLLLGTLLAAVGLAAKLNDQLQSRVVAKSPGGIEWRDFSSRSGRLLDNDLASSWNATWFCWFGAVGLAGITCLEIVPMSMFHVVAYSTLALLFVSQFLNRWLYFASIVTYRMPGAST